MKWYDEFGVAHDLDPAALEAMLADDNRRCIGWAEFPDGRILSTAAMGIAVSIGGPPLMFETVWLRDDEFQDVLDRYPTRESAEAGQLEWLARFEAGYPDGPEDTVTYTLPTLCYCGSEEGDPHLVGNGPDCKPPGDTSPPGGMI